MRPMLKASNGFDITICGLHEIEATLDSSVTHAISILDPGFDEPARVCAVAEGNLLRLRFHDVIESLPLHDAPDEAHVRAILDFGRGLAGHDSPRVLIHCHMGISRSTAAAILLLAQRDGDPDAAVRRVVEIRPVAWPNLRMIEIGDRMLALEARLVRAVRRHHARTLLRRPELRDAFIASGRAREVADFDDTA